MLTPLIKCKNQKSMTVPSLHSMEICTELVPLAKASCELSENLSKDLVRNLTSFTVMGSETTYLICWQLILELLHLRLCIMDDAFGHVYSFHTFLGKRARKGLLHMSLAIQVAYI